MLLQPIALLSAIAVGYWLKHTGRAPADSYKALQKVIFDFTLPAAIIYSFTVRHPDKNMLLISVFGFICAVLPLPVLFLATRKRPVNERFFLMLNGSGMNVGNFTFPVVQALWGTSGMLTSVMYDIGNCLVVAATSNSVASMLLKIRPDKPLSESTYRDEKGTLHVRVSSKDPDARRLERRANIRAMLLSYWRSLSFVVYIILVIMLLAGIRVPQPVGTFLKPIADGNSLCSMVMIGLMMELPTNAEQVKLVLQAFSWRMLFAIICFSAAWFLLPFDPVTRKIVAVTTLSPASIFGTYFTDRMLGDAKLAGFQLTLTSFFSLIVMTVIYFVL